MNRNTPKHNRNPSLNGDETHPRGANDSFFRHDQPQFLEQFRSDAPQRALAERAFGVPAVRLATSTMDAGMLSVLARMDECLRHREQLGDKCTLDRIDDLFRSRFREIGL